MIDETKWEWRAEADDGDLTLWDQLGRVDVLHLGPEQARTLAEQINRPAPTAPADDLPPGVVPAFMLEPGTDMPDGWHVPDGCGWAFAASFAWKVLVERDTPAEPATEWVPLHELRGRKLPGCDWIVGDFGTRGTPSAVTPGYRAYREFATNNWEDFRVDADGKVEVQR